MFGLTTGPSGLIAALLVQPFCSLLVDAVSLPALAAGRGLQRRIAGEHVILADCRDAKGVVSSQMAYYQGTPDPTPEDVAVVHTNPGEAALWINRNTSGLFTDTGVTFTASIGPKVADGEYAGTGDNGYGSFNCWQKYLVNLYVYDGTTCSQVYSCSHDPAPAVLPTPLPTTTSSPSSQGASGLSQGAVIGIAVGVAGAVLLLASIGIFLWYWRRSNHSQKPPTYSKRSAGCCGLFSKKDFAHHPLQTPTQERDYKIGATPTISEVDAKQRTYEMDTAWHRAEMGDGHGRVEMEGHPYYGVDKVHPQEAHEMYSPLPPSTVSTSTTLRAAPTYEQGKSDPK